MLTTLLLTTLLAPPEVQAFCWSPPPADCRHLTPMVWFTRESRPADVAAAAAALPAGRRALFSWDLHRDLLRHPDDVCVTAEGEHTRFRGVWPEHGVAATRKLFLSFFAAYHAAGGPADWLVLDFEDGYSNWSLGGGPEKRADWLAIQNDPRFELLAPKLGFTDLMLVDEWSGKPNYLKWNAVMAGVVDDALRRAVWEPAQALYPQLQGSNYGGVAMSAANAVPDLNGHRQWTETKLFGTHQAPSLYTTIGQLGDQSLDGKKPFGRSPFAGLLLSLNTVRACQRTSAKPLSPWIAWPRYRGDGPTAPPATVGGTPYWRELVLHLALAGGNPILFWNPHPWTAGQKPEDFSTAADEHLLDAVLDEVSQKLAATDRECLTTAAIPWDAKILTTAMRLEDRVLWRVTVQPGVTAVTVTDGADVKSLSVAAGEAGVWYEGKLAGQPVFTPAAG
jgi:hypothetical protein